MEESKNLIIVGYLNFWYGNGAAIQRMRNYALAFVAAKVNVYFCPFSLGIIYSEENSIVVDNRIKLISKYRYISRLRRLLITNKDVENFCDKLVKFANQLPGKTSFIYYPSISSLLLNILFPKYMYIKGQNIFLEYNEVRKFDTVKGLLGYIRRKASCLEEKQMAKYNGIFCITSAIEAYAQKYNKNTIRIPILGDYSVTPDFERRENGRLNFVFTGTVSFVKENLNEFLKALSQLPNELDWHLNMYGPINSYNEKILSNFVATYHNVKGRIKYCGIKPHNEIATLLSEASLLILPRRNNSQNRYGFSTKLSEYLASGTPVLLTDTSDVSLYMENGVNCYLTHGYEASNFLESLVEFINSSQEIRKRIAISAFKIGVNNFDYRNYTETMSNFIFLSK